MLTDKQQAFLWAVVGARMPTHGTGLGGIVGIHLDRHALMQEGFIGNHAVQLGERPFGVGSVGFALLRGGFLPLLPCGAFSNVCQVFQTDQTISIPAAGSLQAIGRFSPCPGYCWIRCFDPCQAALAGRHLTWSMGIFPQSNFNPWRAPLAG